MMHAAHELNGPTYAHFILTTAEVIAALSGSALGAPASLPASLLRAHSDDFKSQATDHQE
jgi:hypothetical protein